MHTKITRRDARDREGDGSNDSSDAVVVAQRQRRRRRRTTDARGFKFPPGAVPSSLSTKTLKCTGSLDKTSITALLFEGSLPRA